MRLHPAGWYFAWKLRHRLAKMDANYREVSRPEEIEHLQLGLLNSSWQASLQLSPWAKALRAACSLPDRFGSLEEYVQATPVFSKSDYQPILDQAPGRAERWMATGGTSARPFRFPVLKGESDNARLNMVWHRRQSGIDYRDDGFLLWGHSHLLEQQGMRRAFNLAQRRLGDALMGYHRFSAYELDDDAMRRAGDALLAAHPDYLVGYTRAIERLVAVNADRRIHFPPMRLVQPTGEAFTSGAARVEVEKFFRAPVVMEYGAVETGPIAYELPDGWQPLWQSHYLEVSDEGELLVTSLYPRALPLLRYRLGDSVEAVSPNLRIERVVGRMNDFIEVGGRVIHPEIISHAVRGIPGVTGYQVCLRDEAAPILRVEAGSAISDDDLETIRGALTRVAPEFAAMAVEQVANLTQGASGKRPMVVRQ